MDLLPHNHKKIAMLTIRLQDDTLINMPFMAWQNPPEFRVTENHTEWDGSKWNRTFQDCEIRWSEE